MPQIAIEPAGGGFAVRIDGEAVRYCGDELDAHHWGKHAFEAVNRGLRRPGEIGPGDAPSLPHRDAVQPAQLGRRDS